MCGSDGVVLSWSLLIRRAQRARRQAEIPLIVLCRFPGPALTQQLPWDSKRPETRSPWVGSYLGTLTPNNFAPPEGSAVAVPGLTDQVALGDYLFRFDAGRNYNDAASAVTDVAQSADSPDFRPLVKSKTSKRSLAAPYVGFTLTAPGSPFEPQTR